MSREGVAVAIRDYRRRVRCTQAALAQTAGVDEDHLWRLNSRGWMPAESAERVLAFIAAHPDGFGPRQKSGKAEHLLAGLAGLMEARRLSGTPARPCPAACARARAEDRWAAGRRAARA